MHDSYDDIRSRISEPPKWFDENAVPRYSDFAPGEQSNIYADRVAFVLIACQNCREKFKVCFSSCSMDRLRWQLRHEQLGVENPCKHDLWDGCVDGSIHFGDPPNTQCCPAGPTMNCLDLRVLEAWERVNFEWVRKPECEVMLSDHDEYEPAAIAEAKGEA
jgi:hypothetical protein